MISLVSCGNLSKDHLLKACSFPIGQKIYWSNTLCRNISMIINSDFAHFTYITKDFLWCAWKKYTSLGIVEISSKKRRKEKRAVDSELDIVWTGFSVPCCAGDYLNLIGLREGTWQSLGCLPLISEGLGSSPTFTLNGSFLMMCTLRNSRLKFHPPRTLGFNFWLLACRQQVGELLSIFLSVFQINIFFLEECH